MDTELRYRLPKVRDVMSSPVIALTEKHTVYDALITFNKYKISTIPVVLGSNDYGLVGVVSEGECLKYLAHNLFYDEMTSDSVGVIMKRDVVCIERNMDIFELEELFQKHKIRHAPVIEAGRVVGSVSRSDILKHLEKFTKEVLKYRHDIIEPLELSMYKDFDMRTKDISENHHFGPLT
ncbi:MAG: CBS domain-containing protein [Bacteriovoracaceae bacterium]|nr:CBS domain-containing protein [Bacteriovoracaceae bacterium]